MTITLRQLTMPATPARHAVACRIYAVTSRPQSLRPDRVRAAQDGGTRCAGFDLGCKKLGGRATVLRDRVRPVAWRAEAGRAFVVRESPTRSRPVYVPLDQRRPQSETLPRPKDRQREELPFAMSA
jgi:hypothetical protein